MAVAGPDVRGCPYSQWLPYASELPAEAAAVLADIKQGLEETVTKRKFSPGLHFWIRCLEGHIQLYRYSLSIEDHVHLIKLLFEVFQITDINRNLQSTVASILYRLLKKEQFLSPAALQAAGLTLTLPWRPFREIILTAFFPKLRNSETPSSSFAGNLSRLIKFARRYFPPEATEEILLAHTPGLCPHDDSLFRNSLLLCMLLPTHRATQAASGPRFIGWVDDLIGVWKWFEHAGDWDGMWLSLLLRAAQTAGAVDWRPHIPYLFAKYLDVLGVPVGASDRVGGHGCLPSVVHRFFASNIAPERAGSMVAYLLGPDGEAMRHLRSLLQAVMTFFHPSNIGSWSARLASFVSALCKEYCNRLHDQTEHPEYHPEALRLTPAISTELATVLLEPLMFSIFSKNMVMVTQSVMALRSLAYLAPSIVLPPLLAKIYPALQTVTESNQTLSALVSIAAIARPLLSRRIYPDGLEHLAQLATLCLPGVDSNDLGKTQVTLQVFSELLTAVPFVDASDSDSSAYMLSEAEGKGVADTALLEDIVSQLLDRVLEVLESQVAASEKHFSVEESVSLFVRLLAQNVFQQVSPAILTHVWEKLFLWVSTHTVLVAAKAIGHMCASVCRINAAAADKFIPWLCRRILDVVESQPHFLAGDANENVADEQLLWWLHLLARICRRSGDAVLAHRSSIMAVIGAAMPTASKAVSKLAGKLLRHAIRSLVAIYPLSIKSASTSADPLERIISRGNVTSPYSDIGIKFHVPTQEKADLAEEMLERFYKPAVTELVDIANGSHPDWTGLSELARRLLVRTRLMVLRQVARVPEVLPESDLPAVVMHQDDGDEGLFVHLKRRAVVTNVSLAVSPQKASRREELCGAIHIITTFLLESRADDTKALTTACKIAGQLLCNRGVKESSWTELMNSHRFRKGSMRDPVLQNKTLPLNFVMDRIHLQHLYRMVWNSHALVLHKPHQTLINDLFAISLSPYASVRKRAQSSLASALRKFPHARKGVFFKAVAILRDPAPERHALKGALYILSGSPMVTICQRWHHLGTFCEALVSLHANDDTTIQKLASQMFTAVKRDMTNSPLLYTIPQPVFDALCALQPTAARLADFFHGGSLEAARQRDALAIQTHTALMLRLVELAHSMAQHWRYELMLASLLVVVTRVAPSHPVAVTDYFARGLAHATIHVRALCLTATSMVMSRTKAHVLREALDKPGPAASLTTAGHRQDNDELFFHMDPAHRPGTADALNAVAFVDKNSTSWSCWPEGAKAYAPFAARGPTPVNEHSQALLAVLADEGVLGALVSYAGQENHDGSAGVFQDGRADLYKGLFRIGPQVLDILRDKITTMCANVQSAAQQRGVAEIVAGLVRGSKHWEASAVQAMWAWLLPQLQAAWAAGSSECLSPWSAAVRYFVYDRDVRRLYPLFDVLLVDTLGDETISPFAQARALLFLQTAFDELSWRGTEIALALLDRCQAHTAHQYKLVRERLARLMHSCMRSLWTPSQVGAAQAAAQSAKTVHFMQTFVTSITKDAGATDDATKQLVARRLKTFLHFVTISVIDGSALVCHPFLPLMIPLLLAAPDISDDTDIQAACKQALQATSELVLPPALYESVCELLLQSAQSPSWHIRRRALLFMQVSLFRNYFAAPREQMIAAILAMLADEQVEVRTLAGSTLSGCVRCGLADAAALRPALLAMAATPVRARRRGGGQPAALEPTGPEEKQRIVQRHAGVLGLAALLEAFPYTVPAWMPATLVAVGDHVSDPDPIRPTVKTAMSEFWRTHRDNWSDMRTLFTEDQLAVITDLLISPSYYA
eukprot:m.22942 g.22942  ORF g.22942 m.22942 type:complete len:1805 (-) comp3830_c0_seq1:81-5495(-)